MMHFVGLNRSSLLAKAIEFIRVAAPEIFGVRPELKRRVKTKGPDSATAVAPATGPGSEKYQRILDAAVEVIAERGYFSSPVSAIAKRAGVADGTIYIYFKSKDDVLRVLRQYFLPLFSSSTSVVVSVTAPGKADEISKGLKDAGFVVEGRTLELEPDDGSEDESESGSEGDRANHPRM